MPPMLGNPPHFDGVTAVWLAGSVLLNGIVCLRLMPEVSFSCEFYEYVHHARGEGGGGSPGQLSVHAERCTVLPRFISAKRFTLFYRRLLIAF